MSEYGLIVAGVSDEELLLIERGLAVCATPAVSFRLVPEDGGGEADLAAVAGRSQQAAPRWLALKKRVRVPKPVLLRHARASGPLGGIRGQSEADRPFVLSRLIALLEAAVAPLAKPESELEPGPEFGPESGVDQHDEALALVMSDEPSGTMTSAAAQGRVLIVDDSLPVRVQLEGFLRGQVAHMDVAENGEQALEFLEGNAYDLVLLDAIMPGIDGYEVCRRIKSGERAGTTRVVMLTGKGAPADRAKGRMAGCDTYLIKPVKQMVLEQVMIDSFYGS